METIVFEKNQMADFQNELLERQAKTDIVVDSDKLSMTGSGNLAVPLPNSREILNGNLNNWSRGQLAEYVGIPTSYYKTMLNGHGGLLADNVNYWLNHRNTEKRLIRVWKDEVIAVLSNKYRPIDNYDVASEVLDAADKVLSAQGLTMQVLTPYLTDRVMTLNVTTLEPIIQYPDGEKYQLGLSVRNSEVGGASYSIEAMIVRNSCTNGHIFGDPIRKRHVGKKLENGDIWSQRTVELQSALTLSETKDAVTATFDLKRAKVFTDKLQGLKQEKIELTSEYTNATQKILGLTDEDRKSIWKKVEQNNKYEFVQAVTAYANDLLVSSANPEKGTDMQKLGGQLVEKKSIWDKIKDQAKENEEKD